MVTPHSIHTVNVSGLTHEGSGVAKIDGFAVFIVGALPGETVVCKIEKVAKQFAQAKLIEIKSSSAERIKPRCKIFDLCGGCDIMHLEYQSQLRFKKQMAEETFRRIGHLDIVVDEIIGMEHPYYYRNKVQIPFQMRDNKAICGYYRRKSHQIVPLEECFIQPKYATEMTQFIKNLANEFKIRAYDETTRIGYIRHVLIRSNHLDEVMIVLIVNRDLPRKQDFVAKITQRYPQVKSIILNINKKDTNVILGSESHVLFGEDQLIDQLFDIQFNISHRSFFQVNRLQTMRLYQRILDYAQLTGNETVIDGYCGVGTITLLLAKHARYVYGIEVVEDAIVDAKQNARLNHISNVEFMVGQVETELRSLMNHEISLIILDPPRKGIDSDVLNSIIESNISKLIYVSCDVATLARDLKILSQAYEIKNMTLVDMFCHTSSVESVVLLESISSKK